MRTSIAAGAVLTAALTGAHAGAADDGHGMIVVPNEKAVVWEAAPPSLPKGIQISLLAGDPARPGNRSA